MITVTAAAKRQFVEITQREKREGQGLRIILRGGGTAQPEFALNFVAPGDVTDRDQVVDAGDFQVVFDENTAKFLEGATVDFVDDLSQSGFKIDAPNAGIPRPTGPLAEAVMRVLEEKINPGVAMHGGRVSLVAIEDDTVYLKFGGGCQGCGMINVTLRQGVEKVLFQEVPQVKKVMDVTDHASGANPYYQPPK